MRGVQGCGFAMVRRGLNTWLGVDIDVAYANHTLATMNPFPSVFARVSPENKSQIVTALQQVECKWLVHLRCSKALCW